MFEKFDINLTGLLIPATKLRLKPKFKKPAGIQLNSVRVKLQNFQIMRCQSPIIKLEGL